MGKLKPLVVQASSKLPLKQYSCEHCGTSLIESAKTPHCIVCSELLGKGVSIQQKSLTASTTQDQALLICQACNNPMTISGTSKTAEELSSLYYCASCGSDMLEAGDDSDELDAFEGSVNDMDSDDTLSDEAKDKDALDKDSEDIQSQTESDTKLALESVVDKEEVLEASMLQWSVVANENSGDKGTLIASSIKTGNPIFIFHKNQTPASLQPLFASSSYVETFNQLAKDRGVAGAVKSFGGSTFAHDKVLSSMDLESMAFNQMQASMLPKLISCCHLAIEGGVKGIYSEVNATLQESLVGELVASGLPYERASTAVRNTLSLHGSDLFGTIIAKALELYNKSEDQREEAKNLIANASGLSYSAYDAEQSKVKAALTSNSLDSVLVTAGFGATPQPKLSLKEQAKALAKELW